MKLISLVIAKLGRARGSRWLGGRGVPWEIRESRLGLYPTTPTQTTHFKIHLGDKSDPVIHSGSPEIDSEVILEAFILREVLKNVGKQTGKPWGESKCQV